METKTQNKQIMNAKNKMLNTRTVCAAALLAFCASASAQSADSLIDKLVQKGILTEKEAKELRAEADKDFSKAYKSNTGLPAWVTAFKINGDVRLRYENFNLPNDQAIAGAASVVDRHRFRYRLRLGAVAVMQEHLEAGLRFTSSDPAGGGGDPISGNTTLTGNAWKKNIYLDLAYGRWSPPLGNDWSLTLTGGKMENPFVFSDSVFDHDYTPEGAAAQLRWKIDKQHTLSLIGGGFALLELAAASKDVYLLGSQLRLDSSWSPRWQTTLGIGYLSIAGSPNLANAAAVANINAGNTRKANGSLAYHMNPIVADVGITHTLDSFPLYKTKFPIKLAGEYIHNPTPPTDNYGWSAGVTFGKAGKKGLWEISYRYKYLGADAWYEELTDSDTGAFYPAALPNSGLGAGYRAGTNLKGHVIKAAYSFTDSLSLQVSYYAMDLINLPPGSAFGKSYAGRLQVDMNWKF